MSQLSPDSSAVRLVIREVVRARFYLHLKIWGCMALTFSGLASRLLPAGLPPPLVVLGYVAVPILVGTFTSAVSVKLFGKIIVLTDATLEARTNWRTSVWRLEYVDETPRLKIAEGGYYCLYFAYRSRDGSQSRPRFQVSLAYVSNADARELLKALLSAMEDFHITRNRATFLERQKNR